MAASGRLGQADMSNEAEGLRVIEGAGQAPEDPLVGQVIDGRYQIESVLGEGGMGLVYRARHVALGKPLAIKVLRPDVSKDDQMIARFKQEAQSASAIGNEHIIDITDFGTLPDGSTYFVMEFLDGRDLTDLIETEGRLPVPRALHIAKQICMALGAAHERGIVHRDLKPDNIFLIRRGRDQDFVKVLDFGIAKVGGTASKLTRAGQVFGTPHYMSPEQCAGRGVDHRTDIYALGIILYELLTGNVPFDADNLMGILTKHLYEEPVPPSQAAPDAGIPPEVEQVVLKCLVKDANKRYASMDEVLADMEAILPSGSSSVVSEPSVQFRTQSAGAGAAGMTATALPGMEKKGSSMGLLIGLGALLLVGAGVGGWLVLGGQQEASTSEQPANTAEADAPKVGAVGEGDQRDEPGDPGATAAGSKQADEKAAQADATGEAPPADTQEQDSHESAKVQLVTEPAGAEVWLDDELLGNTPFAIPRPKKGEKLAVVLKLPGYRDREVRISSFTAENVQVRLEKARSRRSGSRGRGRSRGGSSGTQRPAAAAQPSTQRPAAQPPAKAPPRNTQPTRRRRGVQATEIVDPWTN